MVPGPGGQTHLATYLQLRQMKLLRLEYAELRHATIKDIENVRAICQMEAGRRAGEDPDATVRTSHALGYNETALVQSGHRIASAKVHGGKREPFEILLDRLEAETPGLRAKHDAILAEYGIERADHVLYGFDIDLQTVPFNVDESPDGERAVTPLAVLPPTGDVTVVDATGSQAVPAAQAQGFERLAAALPWPGGASLVAAARDVPAGGIVVADASRLAECVDAGLAARAFVVGARRAGLPAAAAAHGVAGACDVRTMVAWNGVADTPNAVLVGRREVADALGAGLPGAQGPYVPLHLGLPLPLAIVTYLGCCAGWKVADGRGGRHAVGARLAIGQRRDRRADGAHALAVELRHADALAVARRREHEAPRVDDQRAAVGRAAGPRAVLVRRHDVALVLDRPRPEEHLPVVAARLLREAGRHRQQLGARDGERAVQLREAQVVADGQPTGQPATVASTASSPGRSVSDSR